MTITLYDLVYADGRRFSPHVWRTRFALAHKGLEAEPVLCKLTDKDKIAFANATTLPVLVDGDKTVADSWAIACHLEDSYPDRPSLFGGESGRGALGFLNAWADSQLLPAVMRVVAPDLVACLCQEDRAYFKETREARFGFSFDTLVAERPQRLAHAREVMKPIALALEKRALEGRSYLGGDGPSYGDFILGAIFQWARCSSEVDVISPDDGVLHDWFERMLDAFGGLARSEPSRADADI